MEAGRQGAKLDYCDDGNLFNQERGPAAWPLSSKARQEILSGPGVYRLSRRGLRWAFEVHHEELSSGWKENKGSSAK